MPRDDWFRSTEWNDAIAAEFDKRLARARGSRRCQYICLQGFTLLQQKDERLLQAGAVLMRRVLADYPDERLFAGSAHGSLGKYHAARREYRDALEHFRAAVRAEEQGRIGPGAKVYTDAYLQFAETVLMGNLREHYGEALRVLCDGQARHNKVGPLRSDVFRFYVCNARLASREGLTKDAAHFASRALAMAEVTTPQFPRHPTVGIIQLDNALRSELQNLAHKVN